MPPNDVTVQVKSVVAVLWSAAFGQLLVVGRHQAEVRDAETGHVVVGFEVSIPILHKDIDKLYSTSLPKGLHPPTCIVASHT